MFGLSIAEMALLGILLYALFAYVKTRAHARKKKQYYGQTFGDASSTPDVARPEADAHLGGEPSEPIEKMSLGKRLYGIGFLTVWLTIWSVGCFVALRERLSMSFGDEGYIFLTLWLALAIPAWFLAAWTLFRLLRGDEIEFNTDDD